MNLPQKFALPVNCRSCRFSSGSNWLSCHLAVFQGMSAIQLAAKAGAKGERLTEADEAEALSEAKASWPAVQGGAGSDEALAVTVYQPLFEEDASKAIEAEYAGRLLRTGDYGMGEALLNKLPSYLRRSLRHLTKTTDPLPAVPVAAP